jgi:putative transposase
LGRVGNPPLAVRDNFTPENCALVMDTSLAGARVARALDAIIAMCGRPLMIGSNYEIERTSPAILRWAPYRQIVRHPIMPGRPRDRSRVDGRLIGHGLAAAQGLV